MLLIGLLFVVCAQIAPAQSNADPRDLARGRFLVAVRDLPDPNFAETVVFLTDHGREGSAGLVLTRPMKITIGDLIEGGKGTRTGDTVWRGGPVQRTGMMALVRTSEPPEGAKKVVGEAHVLTTREDLEEALDAPEGTLKVFLGYSGWGAGQLEQEVELGTWHIVNGDLDAVFAADTGALWDKLARRMEQRIASAITNRRETEKSESESLSGSGTGNGRGVFGGGAAGTGVGGIVRWEIVRGMELDYGPAGTGDVVGY